MQFKISKGIILSIGLLFVIQSKAQDNFQTTFPKVQPGTSQNIRIAVSDSLGNQSYLPVSILKGKEEGPVFTMIAGVHGFEYPPIIATQALLQEINPKLLKGTLVIVPIASLGSFYGREPFRSAIDNVNLNNAFPGNNNGTVTNQIADIITQQIIPVSNVFLDIHGGDAPEDLLPFICYYRNERKPQQTQIAKELSDKSGFKYVVSYPYTISDEDPAKYAFKQAVQNGKVGVSIESGRLGIVEEDAVALIKNGVYNMLKQLNMYEHSTTNAQEVIQLNTQKYISSKNKGIFYSPYKAGDTILKGQEVGHTSDEFGTILEKYYAPISGIILYKLSTPPVNMDDTVMCISQLN